MHEGSIGVIMLPITRIIAINSPIIVIIEKHCRMVGPGPPAGGTARPRAPSQAGGRLELVLLARACAGPAASESRGNMHRIIIMLVYCNHQ